MTSRFVLTHHGIGKGRGDGDQHPPDYPHQELLSVTLDEGLHNGTVHLGDLQADEGAHDQEKAVTGQETGLGTAPAGDDDAQQLQQGAEELAVQLDLLLGGGVGVGAVAGGGAGLALGGLAGGSGLLLGDGIPDAVDEGDEEGKVDGAGDAGAVRDVELGQMRDGFLDGAIGGQDQFRLRACHACDLERESCLRKG